MEQDKLTHDERRRLEALAIAEQHYAITATARRTELPDAGEAADVAAVLDTAKKYDAWLEHGRIDGEVTPDIGQQRVDHMTGGAAG
jgi:hypothetical protein